MLLYHVGTNYGDAWRNRVGYMIMFFLFIGYTLVFVLEKQNKNLFRLILILEKLDAWELL